MRCRLPSLRNEPATKARRVLAALIRIGWEIKRRSGSHRTLTRKGWDDVTFAFRDDVERILTNACRV